MAKIIKKILPHFDSRPAGCSIDTVIIHAMHAVSCRKHFDAEACIALLDQHKVAAHYLIDRRGSVYQLVEEAYRAWHAGVSQLPFKDDRRENVNHFSIGIELVGYESKPFTKSQYRSLADLISEIDSRYPLRYILGHSDIAPQRKSDPGSGFSWQTLRKALQHLNACSNTMFSI